MDEDQEQKAAKEEERIGMSDREVAKLIVVTQKDRRARLDRTMAEMINDGLAMYEQEISMVGGMAWHALRCAALTRLCRLPPSCWHRSGAGRQLCARSSG